MSTVCTTKWENLAEWVGHERFSVLWIPTSFWLVPIGLQRAARNSHDDFGCQKPFQEGHIGIPLPLTIMQAVINTDLDG